MSADNRYKLFVNGQLVSFGPARGDIFHWNYETVDLAPHLQMGKNVIAAVVWNYGDLRPEAQISYQTGFIMQGDSTNEKIINTDKTWKCSAPGLKEGRYTGGDTAYIHLSAFPTGGDYPLTKKYKKTVTGFTSNNTRFVCRLS